MQALYKHLGSGDEALLSTAFSWMRKAADDKQDGKTAAQLLAVQA